MTYYYPFLEVKSVTRRITGVKDPLINIRIHTEIIRWEQLPRGGRRRSGGCQEWREKEYRVGVVSCPQRVWVVQGRTETGYHVRGRDVQELTAWDAQCETHRTSKTKEGWPDTPGCLVPDSENRTERLWNLQVPSVGRRGVCRSLVYGTRTGTRHLFLLFLGTGVSWLQDLLWGIFKELTYLEGKNKTGST